MPIKKVGMPFEIYPGPKEGDDGQKILFAKPKSGLKITLKDIEDYCSIGYAIRKGDMARIFQTFEDVATRFMSQGYTIETPIGTFEPKLDMKRQVTNPDEVHHDDVQLEGIQFRASKSFKKTLTEKIGSDGFRYMRKPSTTRLIANEKHLLQALKKSLEANNGYTNAASFAQYSGLTIYSARIKLSKWCYGKNPLLKSAKFGRATIYTEI